LEPYKEGGAAGFVPDLPAMLETYYEARGWDKISGKPSKEKLIELGLEFVIGDW
jgi:aldehyde:ferredoxin oxidoreductase